MTEDFDPLLLYGLHFINSLLILGEHGTYIVPSSIHLPPCMYFHLHAVSLSLRAQMTDVCGTFYSTALYYNALFQKCHLPFGVLNYCGKVFSYTWAIDCIL